MHVCMHACMHACTKYIYIHTYTRTRIQIRVVSHVCMDQLSRLDAFMNKSSCICAHARMASAYDMREPASAAGEFLQLMAGGATAVPHAFRREIARGGHRSEGART